MQSKPFLTSTAGAGPSSGLCRQPSCLLALELPLELPLMHLQRMLSLHSSADQQP